MVSLLDVLPAGVKVSVRGKEIDVAGVSAKGVAVLLSRFPELRDIVSGKSVDMATLFAMGGDVVSAIIAAGCGAPGDEAMEAVAGSLSIDEQADILTAILRQTMPGGVVPFVDKLSRIGVILNPDAAIRGTDPAMKSPKASKR